LNFGGQVVASLLATTGKSVLGIAPRRHGRVSHTR
jgi:hypothetical protein